MLAVLQQAMSTVAQLSKAENHVWQHLFSNCYTGILMTGNKILSVLLSPHGGDFERSETSFFFLSNIKTLSCRTFCPLCHTHSPSI